MWSYTSTHPYVFMVWQLVKHRDNFNSRVIVNDCSVLYLDNNLPEISLLFRENKETLLQIRFCRIVKGNRVLKGSGSRTQLIWTYISLSERY